MAGSAPAKRLPFLFVLVVGGLTTSSLAIAATGPGADIAFGQMAMGLLGGLALFLFGIDQLTGALKAVAGDRMRSVLQRLTSNRFTGAMTGALVTAVIQSSSVTTVLVVGFTTAGLMSFSQSIGVIMGANIGTTITAQIVAFKVTKAALLMIAIGFGLFFFTKRDVLRHYGGIVMGLGLVFFGMNIMSEAMQPLRDYQPFLDLMQRMESPLIGILIAAGFTALVQSSSATTAIVIVMAGQGLISLPAGIALAFGANIGTCVTALLAAIGKPREAIRAAITHVLFNVAGVLLWIGLIDQLAQFVIAFSPEHPELAGTERAMAETPRQIANAHTIFNIANTLVFICLTTLIARLVEWLVPDRPLNVEAVIQAKYLDEDLLSTPAIALEQVHMEFRRMGKQVAKMLNQVMPAVLTGSAVSLKEIRKLDDRVDHLHAQIVTYLGKISRQKLSERQTSEVLRLMDAVNDLETIGDVIEVNLVNIGLYRIEKNVEVSGPTREMLNQFHAIVLRSLKSAVNAVADDDMEAAKSVVRLKKEIMQIAKLFSEYESKRLIANEPNRLEAYTMEIGVTEKLQRVYFYAKRMARTVARGRH
ncbi:MAG: Na/Pi cotransporter family protein [Woeseiaceae bacterium]|nr:Na/Pi cotransporter family protein [Woeseiaceae bacterium]